jgi:hypothetical protein
MSDLGDRGRHRLDFSGRVVNRDDLDAGICDGPDAPRLPPLRMDAEVLGFVLFADIDWDDPEAVAYRRAEWEALFGDVDVRDQDAIDRRREQWERVWPRG